VLLQRLEREGDGGLQLGIVPSCPVVGGHDDLDVGIDAVV